MRLRNILVGLFGGTVLLAGVWLVGRRSGLPLRLLPTEPEVVVSTGTVRSGDTFWLLMQRHSITRLESSRIESALNKSFKVRLIKPEHAYRIETSTAGIFQKLLYIAGPLISYSVVRSSTGIYEVEQIEQKTIWREKKITATVSDSLYADLLKGGYHERLVAGLVSDLSDNVFGWSIDFFTEQRPGDTLTVLMEQEFRMDDPEPLWGGRGRILAAVYEGQGTRQKKNVAIRFQPAGANRPSYYDPGGRALQKVFRRSPFTHGLFRISSGFSLRRLHPILRTYRAHHGIDYAAARGTPVASIGGGRVVLAGWKSGFGNTVEIQHDHQYRSRYGHLSRIGVRTGQSVGQGQYVGNVGSTGLSTGPHLHFEMLVNGRQTNFLTLNFPSAAALSKVDLLTFQTIRDPLVARLENL